MAEYDAIIIGAGQAGPSLAFRLANAGMKVAVVERARVGGTCVNTGCTPTKALVASAYTAHLARRAAEYGVSVGPVRVDMREVKARMDAIVAKSRGGLEGALQKAKNCTLVKGHARFISPREVSVGDQVLKAERIFINVGGRPSAPPMPGLDQVAYLTSSSILDLDTIPEHLVIVGGSYIGLEYGQMFRRFGSEVTIVEMAPRLIQREDEDVSTAIAEILEREGINLRLNAKCIALAPHEKGVAVTLDCENGPPIATGSHVLLAVGRRVNTDDLGLEAAGIAYDSHGIIIVDDELCTNVPGIWALGDCNGKGAFTHTAYNDFEIVAANLLDGASRRVSDRVQTYALYIDPPLGRAGMTQAQAVQAGKRVLIGQRPMTRVARAVEKGETQGFMKVMVDADTNELLGASILGPGGDEVVHTVLDMIDAKAPYTVLRDAVHIHPTVAELVPTILGRLEPAK
ncbi:FAD-containing oxidoreductase [Microvirga terricola]|uniref:FAD-containing oxidoreductase n=1 Tax=Microvirga terricola TaxID=2719797 RepID=A0ABX0VBD2_9HYPH|nr:FAD-containing oxidoreductase [Microvirga terricola]NIX76661.1 FAD-containing oxidoreductase [Microvirga terricola]